MHAIGSSILLGFVAAAISACGGDSKKNPQADGIAEAGAGSIDTGAGHGGTGPGTGGGSSTTAGGVGGASTSGGGTPSAGGTSAAGASPVADGIGGDGTGSGGAASGGASTVSGTGGVDLIEAPPNCESVRQAEDAETCSYEYTCDGRTHFDSCRRDSYGTWACECGTFSTPRRYFEIDGVEGLDACSVIARVCEGDVPVSPTRTCRPKEMIVDEATCSSHATCGNALDLGPGIVARVVDHVRSECIPRADAHSESLFDCSCAGDSFAAKDYLVTGPSIGAVCEPMLAFCLSEDEPAFSGRLCLDSEPTGTVEEICSVGEDCQGCMMHRECGMVAPLDEEVSILDFLDSDNRYILCRPVQGELQCTCARTVSGVYGDETVSSEILDVCRESSDVCPR